MRQKEQDWLRLNGLIPKENWSVKNRAARSKGVFLPQAVAAPVTQYQTQATHKNYLQTKSLMHTQSTKYQNLRNNQNYTTMAHTSAARQSGPMTSQASSQEQVAHQQRHGGPSLKASQQRHYCTQFKSSGGFYSHILIRNNDPLDYSYQQMPDQRTLQMARNHQQMLQTALHTQSMNINKADGRSTGMKTFTSAVDKGRWQEIEKQHHLKLGQSSSKKKSPHKPYKHSKDRTKDNQSPKTIVVSIAEPKILSTVTRSKQSKKAEAEKHNRWEAINNLKTITHENQGLSDKLSLEKSEEILHESASSMEANLRSVSKPSHIGSNTIDSILQKPKSKHKGGSTNQIKKRANQSNYYSTKLKGFLNDDVDKRKDAVSQEGTTKKNRRKLDHQAPTFAHTLYTNQEKPFFDDRAHSQDQLDEQSGYNASINQEHSVYKGERASVVFQKYKQPINDVAHKRNSQLHASEPNLIRSLSTNQQSSFDAYNAQILEDQGVIQPKRTKALDSKLSSKQETVQMQKKIKQLISNVSFQS